MDLILEQRKSDSPGIQVVKITGNIKRAIQGALGRLGFRLVRIGLDDQKIGMELCLKGLARRGFYPEFILDVGAATGQWTRLALRYWPTAQYFLIEPLDERREQLTALHQEHQNVSFILAAAGASSGQSPMGILPDQLDGSSFLYGDVFRVVPVIHIDELLQTEQIKQPQFMKLDVQGYELEVLRGAELTMRNCPLILLELQFFRFTPSMELMHESVAWMVEKGFRPYELVDVLRRPYDGAMGQCDLLFVKEDCWLASNNSWN